MNGGAGASFHRPGNLPSRPTWRSAAAVVAGALMAAAAPQRAAHAANAPPPLAPRRHGRPQSPSAPCASTGVSTRSGLRDGTAADGGNHEGGSSNVADPLQEPPPPLPFPPRMQAVLDFIARSRPSPMQPGSIQMYYDPTRELGAMPLPESVRGLTSEDVMPEAVCVLPDAVQQGLPGAGRGGTASNASSATASSSPAARRDFASTVAALLFVSCGGLDHAHNLVRPGPSHPAGAGSAYSLVRQGPSHTRAVGR